MIISRRAKVRIISFLVVSFVILGLFAFVGINRAHYYERQLEYTYQRSLNELCEYVDNIDETLEKGVYANTSTMLSSLSAALWRDAYGAKASLSQLPTGQLDLQETNAFFSKVGEFAKSLNTAVAQGIGVTEDDHDTMNGLRETISSLSQKLNHLKELYNREELSLTGGMSLSFSMPEIYSDTSVSAKGFNSAQESLADLPRLIYDGPYSDHIMDKEPEALKNKKEVSKAEAKKIAAKYLNVDVNTIEDGNDEDGLMPSYRFNVEDRTIAVTKIGGFVVYFTNARQVSSNTIKQEEAVEKAKAFLEKMGFTNMNESYYEVSNGICYANFAYYQGDIICYPDLIKVGVAMDTGEIFSMDARGFLTNHIAERELEAPAVSEAEARLALSDYLTVIKVTMVIVPTSSESEAYCYEFHCIGENDEELLVYINTQSGLEQDILILLYSEDGVLTK